MSERDELFQNVIGEIMRDGPETLNQRVHNIIGMVQAARARGDQGAEPVAFGIFYEGVFQEHAWSLDAANAIAAEDYAGLEEITVEPVYTQPQPQPAVPEGIDVAIDMLEDYASALGNGDLDGAGHSTTQAIYEVIDMLSTPTTPQADGWMGITCKRPNHWDADVNAQVWLTDGKSLPVLCQWDRVPDFGYWMPTGLKRPQPPADEAERAGGE